MNKCSKSIHLTCQKLHLPIYEYDFSNITSLQSYVNERYQLPVLHNMTRKDVLNQIATFNTL